MGSTAFITKDAAGNPLTPDYGYMEYDDTQKLVIQELPEYAPPGQLPRSITVYLNGSLCNLVKPGDRVEVTGIYKTVPTQVSKYSGVFETALIAIGITELKIDLAQRMTAEDIKNIKHIAADPGAFALLSTGIAPHISGHNLIK